MPPACHVAPTWRRYSLHVSTTLGLRLRETCGGQTRRETEPVTGSRVRVQTPRSRVRACPKYELHMYMYNMYMYMYMSMCMYSYVL